MGEGDQYKPAEHASYYSNKDATIVAPIPYSQLYFHFQKNPNLASRFYKLLSYVYSNQIIVQNYLLQAGRRFIQFVRQMAEINDRPLDDRKASQKESSVVQDAENSQLLQKLKVPASEVILAKFPCKLKRDLRQGILVIFTEFIIIANSFWGLGSNQTRIYISNISNFMLASDHTIEFFLHSSNSMLLDLSSQHVGEVIHLLNVLVEQHQVANLQYQVPERVSHYSLEFTESELKNLVTFGSKQTFRSGETVYEQGVVQNCLFQVETGQFVSIRSSRKPEDANHSGSSEEPIPSEEVAIYESGSFFGLLPFLQGGLSSTSLVAQVDSTVHTFTRDNLEAFCGQYPGCAPKLYRKLCRSFVLTYLKTQHEFCDFKCE